ncbi:MAG TPA: sigma-70 family RNA polymerase sigma factor [Chitinispirillaceae bacterium]|nr:sigma-70 family RNA polymerase sigma factor [Chitinispirillaceae bacterium]
MEELDSVTLNKAICGDNKAFRALYDHYSPYIWRLLFRMTGNKPLAEELLQETFIRVHAALRKFKGDSLFSTWIYRIAHNAVLMNYRQHKKFKCHDPFEDQVASESHTDNYLNKQFISKVLAELSIEDRFLLVAREIDGLSFEEISLIYRTSAGTLRTRLSRLKDNIRNRFAETSFEKEAVA